MTGTPHDRSAATPTTHLPYRNPNLPVAERVSDLLSRLTLEQKAGQLVQYFYLPIPADVVPGPDVPPEHLALLGQPRMVESAIAAGRAGSVLFTTNAETTNRLQRIAVEQSPHAIPLLVGLDVIHGFRTIFPVPIGLAATWDLDIIEQAQAIAAREARVAGITWTFAPMVDIARDPRWGRIVEGAGEDPFLGGAVAAAQVRGFQGDLGAEHILAGPKHLAGYGASRGGRDYDDAEISDSELWNVYLPPFRAAIDAGAANIMSAYMDLNGVPASANTWLLTDVLRDTLGFDGFVVSDANAVRSLEVQHFAKDHTDAAARAVRAGLDMEMCMLAPAFDHLPEAVDQGLVTEAEIDRAAARVLTAKFRLGLFENPYTDEPAATEILETPAHRDLARTAAERSIVLLKNDNATLPLHTDTLTSIAVIGQLADSKRDALGPWVFAHHTDETGTVLDALRTRIGATVRVEYAPGASIPERVIPSPFDRMDPTVETTPADYDDTTEIDRAVQLARAADIAVVIAGQRQNQIGETASTATLDLPGRQLEQLQRIAATGTTVVLVLLSGRPLDLRWADEHIPAIVQAWYPGTCGGDALASILLGDVSPAGRLPFTWPRHAGQIPMIYAHHRTFHPEQQGIRYYDEPSTPLYPFGHGLSYAHFEYTDLRTDRTRIPLGDTVTVTVDVTNTSDRPADEVTQLYTHQRHGTSSRPIRELKGFQRHTFAPAETRTLTFELGPDHLSYWSSATGTYIQDITTIDLRAGGNSDAPLTTTIEITSR
ncbi:glycoside hydrolase family 3 N-terminal domain-containing protein [Nocardia sp. BMG111209]|uniref:glycoside hydrolase family 3 N-terminal domain-containing protein n=1 Tax=Nocardia sp. BMG111209 TaxID=1160137 RepID=UPI000381A822|nr:glycoside hydrolase family 3 N-terminal domain-containing protein [Nocardia sp. BMG111209]